MPSEDLILFLNYQRQWSKYQSILVPHENQKSDMHQCRAKQKCLGYTNTYLCLISSLVPRLLDQSFDRVFLHLISTQGLSIRVHRLGRVFRKKHRSSVSSFGTGRTPFDQIGMGVVVPGPQEDCPLGFIFVFVDFALGELEIEVKGDEVDGPVPLYPDWLK